MIVSMPWPNSIYNQITTINSNIYPISFPFIRDCGIHLGLSSISISFPSEIGLQHIDFPFPRYSYEKFDYQENVERMIYQYIDPNNVHNLLKGTWMEKRDKLYQDITEWICKSFDIIYIRSMIKFFAKKKNYDGSKTDMIIDDTGIDHFERRLFISSTKYRKIVFDIPSYIKTSQECAQCGHYVEKNYNSDKTYCDSCGHLIIRKYNSADNILAYGRTILVPYAKIFFNPNIIVPKDIDKIISHKYDNHTLIRRPKEDRRDM